MVDEREKVEMTVVKTAASVIAVFVLTWLGAVLYGAGKHIYARYRESGREQNRHYRGWMR